VTDSIDRSLPHLVAVEPLQPYERNARTHSPAQIEQIKASFRQFGFVGVLAYDDKGLAIGHGRRQAALEMWAAGETIFGPGKREPLPKGMAPAVDITGLTDPERRALIIADNKLALNAGWDNDMLAGELAALSALDFTMPTIGFDPKELNRLISGGAGKGGAGNMAAEFLIPPFTVLNAREGWWQERKRAWLALGIKSEIGRGANALDMSAQMAGLTDPAEIEAWNAARRAGGGTGRVFGQDFMEGEGTNVEMGYLRQSTGAKDNPAGGEHRGDNPRSFTLPDGQSNYLKGALTVEISTDPYRKKAGLGGVTMDVLSSHPRYYEQKSAAEARLGRKLTPEEFERDHWVLPDSEISSGTSIFDPVLCELAYRWFSPPAGRVLDPFAGGSVRGIVAAALGRSYVGIDLRVEQIAANRAQWPGVAAQLDSGVSSPPRLAGAMLGSTFASSRSRPTARNGPASRPSSIPGYRRRRAPRSTIPMR
jgi:hypothetical protein